MQLRRQKAASHTLCPGNLYWSALVSTAQINTSLLADPHATLRPSADHAQRSRFFSKPWACPEKTDTQRSSGANGRTSQERSVLSIAFDSRWLPSGESESPCGTRKRPGEERL